MSASPAIRDLGRIPIPPEVVEYATGIRLENYRTSTPTRFQVRSLAGSDAMMGDLSRAIGLPRERLDFVYFSVCKGAEPHVDALDPARFTDTTYVVPVVLPPGRCAIQAGGEEAVVELGRIYQFDHTELHSMTLEDTESGCVVVMVAEKREGAR